jgi:hypothetical protein
MRAGLLQRPSMRAGLRCQSWVHSCRPLTHLCCCCAAAAGDAFTAGFLWKLQEAGGIDKLAADATQLHEAVVFASACGALTCTKPGAIGAQPTLEECEKLFAAKK